jgi:hypothetical protein
MRKHTGKEMKKSVFQAIKDEAEANKLGDNEV